MLLLSALEEDTEHDLYLSEVLFMLLLLVVLLLAK